jgi:hypothetical protein
VAFTRYGSRVRADVRDASFYEPTRYSAALLVLVAVSLRIFELDRVWLHLNLTS